MKTITVLLTCLLAMNAWADGVVDHGAPSATMHRYIIERTFPAGALAGLDAATKEKVNANNASVGVRWVQSFATPDQTKTYCVYEGPSEAAIREAAALNHMSVDRVTEVPVTLLPR